jgi:DNA-binding transcriptional ArsR family regulator
MLSFFDVDYNMSGSTAEKRLDRLAKSGVSFCEDTHRHAKDLRELAERVTKPGALEKQSRIFKALADETRLGILNLLRAREMCVCEIMVALHLTQPTASHHLRILENTGLVKDSRKGKWVFYKIADPRFVERILKSDV